MKKYISLLVFLLLLTGCGAPPKGVIKPEETAPKPKTIIASFYPLAYMAEGVAGGNARVVNMAGGADVHEYTPTPQDMVGLRNADVVLYQGARLEPWAEDIIPSLQKAGISTLAVVRHLDLLATEKQADEHNDEHKHGAFDPHTWLDPALAQVMVDAIAEAIIAVDPDNTPEYRRNAAALKGRFAALDEAYSAALEDCKNAEAIVSHSAYGYLAARYGMTLRPIVGLSTQDEPSAKTLVTLKKSAREGMTHILVEENKSHEFAETLARETGLKTLPVNPLGRGPLDPKKDFFTVMEENLEGFKIALSCG